MGPSARSPSHPTPLQSAHWLSSPPPPQGKLSSLVNGEWGGGGSEHAAWPEELGLMCLAELCGELLESFRHWPCCWWGPSAPVTTRTPWKLYSLGCSKKTRFFRVKQKALLGSNLLLLVKGSRGESYETLDDPEHIFLDNAPFSSS